MTGLTLDPAALLNDRKLGAQCKSQEPSIDSKPPSLNFLGNLHLIRLCQEPFMDSVHKYIGFFSQGFQISDFWLLIYKL